MDRIAAWTEEERKELFQLTETKRGIPAVLVEKDFWVCWVLGKLFNSQELENKILFKGGTSLSKVFNLIERFSEDIDLILDWSEFIPEDADIERSNTQQTKFNLKTNEAAQKYLKTSFLPTLKSLIGKHCQLSIDEEEPLHINIAYPASFREDYVRPVILLETGPLAAWEPHADYSIKSYAAEVLPEQFKNPVIDIRSIEAERTFWEKVTILHVEAHRPIHKPVKERYSRHYYDMLLLGKSKVKQRAFDDLELLKNVVDFKDKFYHQAWARYDLAVPSTMKLYPPDHIVSALKRDYKEMTQMIFGDTPTFVEIMDSIKNLEVEINALEV